MLNLGEELQSAQAEINAKSTSERIQALKRIIPQKEVDLIVEKHNPDRRACSKCPAAMMAWFVVALGLFGDDCYRQVFKWLHRFRRRGTPTAAALSIARAKLGVAVMRELFEKIVGCLCDARVEGAFYAGLRLVAVDGFVLDLPDTEANREAFGKPSNGGGEGAFPQARIVALCEIGSHAMFSFLMKPLRCGEVTIAKQVYESLQSGSLLLFDIGFCAFELMQQVLDGDSHFLGRAKTGRILEPIRTLPDGSFLAKIYATDYDRIKDRNGTVIRVIEYTLNDSQRTGHHEKHRLVTSLLDADAHPAKDLIELYHERWEEEIAIDEIKTHQRARATLRSHTPAGVEQEIYGLLLAHFVIRKLMFEAAAEAGVAPRRISFTGALKILRCRLPETPRSKAGIAAWRELLIAEISEEILPPRRNRVNPRVIKKQQSKWPKAQPHHRKLPPLEKEFADTIVLLI